MTGHISMDISPDGITGMIFAMEGIRGCVTLLNGPMGCRFYHSTTSQFLSIHPLLYLPSRDGERIPVDYNHLDNWFFRQQRVPCTYLDGEDYVFGTVEKVREGLLYLKEHIQFEVLAVVNSPGASLIGDRLADMAVQILPDRDIIVLESPGFSVGFDHGYEQACLQLLRQVSIAANSTGESITGKSISGESGTGKIISGERSTAENTTGKSRAGENGAGDRTPEQHSGPTKTAPVVNVLGLSIWDRYFEGDREELEQLFADCGIRVNCFLAADCSMDQVRRMGSADLNIVLAPDRGAACASCLQELTGVPYYQCDTLPIGFAAVEKMIREICALVGADPGKALEKSRRARALAWYKINGIYQSSGLPQGALFAIAAQWMQVYSYSAFFMDYLGMIPDALTVTGTMQPSAGKRLSDLLEQAHARQALEKPFSETRAQLIFSDANHIASLTGAGHAFCGIEISLPGMGYTDLVKKTHLGINGALFLIEQVLNGLMTRL